MSLRKKRNFKALQLPGKEDPGDSSGPVAARPAPRRRPPPVYEDESAESKSAMHATITSTLASLDMNAKRLDLKDEDLTELHELGSGNGGSVMKVQHTNGMFLAKKIVLIDAKPSVRKQILRELQILHACRSPYIISVYGSYIKTPNLCICMEFCEYGSFDNLYKKLGPIHIDIVGMVALAVLEGLMYLYTTHKIIHRDIKPSNILLNAAGDIKLCDFGVSGELENSIANTFVGTSTYMSPERIQGAEYSVKSDVWSLGITLIELAVGHFPWSSEDDEHPEDMARTLNRQNKDLLQPSTPNSARHSRRKSKGVSLHGGTMLLSILELMHLIVQEPPPRLPEGKFSPEVCEFVDGCLEKDIERRKLPAQLLAHPWMEQRRTTPVNMKAWIESFPGNS